MYLVDTNVWLEVLLEQEHHKDAYEFLTKTESSSLFITDFTVYSIGIILTRLKKPALLKKFYRDVFLETNVRLIRLLPSDLEDITKNSGKYGLDFDDAFQYTAAEKFKLAIVSFDDDFDGTELGRKTPTKKMGGS